MGQPAGGTATRDPFCDGRVVLGTLEKAGSVLALFTVATPEWGVTEAGRRLGMPKSSLHAVFSALAAIDLLECRPGGRYRLGWRFAEQCRTLLATTPYRVHALRAMRTVVSRHGETMHLATWSSSQVVYIDSLQPIHGVAGASTTPTRRPAHTSAVGKVLLASRSDGELDRHLTSNGLPQLTEHTIRDRSELAESLMVSRVTGVAYDNEEGRDGVCCVGAPLRAPDGNVVAAISICASEARFRRQQEDYRRAVQAAAQDAAKCWHDAELQSSAV